MKKLLKKKNITRRLIFFIPALFFILILLPIISDKDLSAEKEKFTINSHDNTGFPLTGKHRTVPCSECHIKGVIKNTPDNCEACHWERKQDDRYNLQLGYQCNNCHTPFGWKKLIHGSWDHFQETGFRREGIHRTLDCFNCHKSSFHTGLQGDCISCHREDYEKSDEPDHRLNNFPEDCTLCHHSQVSWEGGVFNHTSFTLEGAHKTLDCSDCHSDGVYSGRSSDCVSCHISNYNNTRDPNHRNAGFPTSCDSCHSAGHYSWNQAVFNHNFPINSGKHNNFSCTDCHLTANYRVFSCTDCHEHDKTSIDKEHEDVSGYIYNSQNCYSCHPNGIAD